MKIHDQINQATQMKGMAQSAINAVLDKDHICCIHDHYKPVRVAVMFVDDRDDVCVFEILNTGVRVLRATGVFTDNFQEIKARIESISL